MYEEMNKNSKMTAVLSSYFKCEILDSTMCKTIDDIEQLMKQPHMQDHAFTNDAPSVTSLTAIVTKTQNGGTKCLTR